MREAVGPDFIIEIRVSGREGTEGGVEIEETTEFLKRCEGIINAVHISSGTYGGVTSESAVSHGIFGPKGYNIKMVEYVKQHTKGMQYQYVDNKLDLILSLRVDAGTEQIGRAHV